MVSGLVDKGLRANRQRANVEPRSQHSERPADPQHTHRRRPENLAEPQRLYSSGQVEVRWRVEWPAAIASQTGAAPLTWSRPHGADQYRAWRWLRCGSCVCVGRSELIGCAHLARSKSAGAWSGLPRIASQTGAALSPGRGRGADHHRAWRWLRCRSCVCVRRSGADRLRFIWPC